MRKTGQILAVAGLVAYFGACTSEDRKFGAGAGAAAGALGNTGGATGKSGGAASTTGGLGGTGVGGNAVVGSAGVGPVIEAKVPCQNTAACNDGNQCNGAEICAAGFCAAEGVDQTNGTACTGAAAPTGAAGAAGMGNLPAKGSFCTAGSCVPGRCGDNYVDSLIAQEECDDGNDTDADGCDSDCTFTCSQDAHCDDAQLCNGAETCDLTTHLCKGGTPVADAANLACDTSKNCRNGQCVLVGCGNGTKEGVEECDDSNNVDNDGCQADCTWTCEADADCNDSNACNGAETCDKSTPTTPLCKPGTAVVCAKVDDCTTNTCNPSGGACVLALIDGDSDGEASTTLGACGTDCNDADKEIGSRKQEVCNDQKDNDCNPQTIDDTQTRYFLDCDGDGFAAKGAGSALSCELPSPSGSCERGQADKWTTLPPANPETWDCYDRNPEVHPRQSSFTSAAIFGLPPDLDYDYNCDRVEEPYYTAIASKPCIKSSITNFCVGNPHWNEAVVPECGASAAFLECQCATISKLGCFSTCAWEKVEQTQICR